MSVALHVKLSRPVSLDEIEGAVSSALAEILNLDSKPDITARFDESDLEGSRSNGLLTEGSIRILCSLAGHDAQAAVTPITVPVQVDTNDGSYSFADQGYLSVSRYSGTSPLSWALVAAAALGAARILGSEIEDNSGFFSNSNIQGPDEFCRNLRAPKPQTDPESAAEALYNTMPKSAEVTEWLKKQLG